MVGQLVGGLIFGSIGFVAFMYGKGESRLKLMIIGAALMAYPYFVPNTLAVFIIGGLLTAALYLFRE